MKRFRAPLFGHDPAAVLESRCRLGMTPKCKISRYIIPSLLFAATSLLSASGQGYSINWYAIGGGGGTSTNSEYSLTGTIGQPFAGGPLTDGNYTLTGGFWSLFAVQTPGAPLLNIQLISPTAIMVSWPAPSTGFVLQQNGDLSTTNWVAVTNSVVLTNGRNSVIVSPQMGNQYYRLVSP
jgi:hypothetical protein